ncbi:hypothetical protein AVEN_39967-1, partial [Araneus ventricosus]
MNLPNATSLNDRVRENISRQYRFTGNHYPTEVFHRLMIYLTDKGLEVTSPRKHFAQTVFGNHCPGLPWELFYDSSPTRFEDIVPRAPRNPFNVLPA